MDIRLMQNQSIERLQLLQQQRAEALLALPAAAETMDEAAFMQYAMTQAENLTGSQIAFIHFVDANEENIELVTWSKRTLESYCHAVYNRHYPVSQAGIWADAVRQHQAVVFNDYPAYAQKRGLPEGHAALQRLISLPVIEHGKVVMLCGIGNKAEDYSDVDVDTLQLIGNDIWRLIQLSRNRKQLERFSRIIERSHSEVFTFDANTLLFVDANASAQKNLGYTQDELRTMTPLSIKPEMTPAGFERLLAPLRDGTQDMVRFTTLHRRKNGTSYIADIQLELHREANPIFIAMARDITERRQAEQSLRDALQIVEASSIVHFRIDAKDQLPVTYVSTNIKHWGYSPQDFYARQYTFLDLVHPEDIPVIEQALTQLDPGLNSIALEYRIIARDGRTFWVEDRTRIIRDQNTAAPLYYECVISDNDAKKRYEQHLSDMLAEQVRLNHKLEEAGNQLLQSEKMASIGQLAAGVAHELNNPIGFVSSNFGTLENYFANLMAIIDAYGEAENTITHCCPQVLERVRRIKQEKDYEFLRTDITQLMNESKEGLNRVAGIVKDLKDFSRPGDAQMQWADIRKGLLSTINIIWNELKYKCTVNKVFNDIPEIWCSPSQLNQVFLNLLVNASHAIADKGEITITTGQHDHEVFLSIADTGEGIVPENIKRIFDPFFTTKPVGKGTGLGLSLSYSIIQKHRGRIEVSSQPGKGSVFTVWLPIKPAAENN